MASKYDKTLMDHLCDYEQGIRILFTFSSGFLLLSLVWLYFLQPGTAEFAVTVVNLFGLSVLALLSGFVLTRCD